MCSSADPGNRAAPIWAIPWEMSDRGSRGNVLGFPLCRVSRDPAANSSSASWPSRASDGGSSGGYG
eukprot:1586320-Prymnesium_polylepis.1